MWLLLQTMTTLWNYALGADIIGTIFFFFVAWKDSYSEMIVFVNILCFFSNLLWAKMFSDLQRNERTIYFFLGLSVVALVGSIFAWRAKVGESEEDEYEYEYYSGSDDEDDDDIHAKNAKKLNDLAQIRGSNNKKHSNQDKKKNR
jgi:hypothetical protein